MRGSDSPEYVKARRRLQRRKKRYMELREELEAAGEIPVEPSGAIRDERAATADPLDGLPEMVRQALRDNWATPDAAKRAVVAKLLEPFYQDQQVIDADGNLVSVPTPPKVLNELARTLLAADNAQYERDHPDNGKDRGGTVPTVLNLVEVVVGNDNRKAVTETTAVPPEPRAIEGVRGGDR